MHRGSDLLSVERGKAIFPLEVLTLSGNIFGGEEQHGCCVVFGEADKNVKQLSLEDSYPSIIFVFFLEGQQGIVSFLERPTRIRRSCPSRAATQLLFMLESHCGRAAKLLAKSCAHGSVT